MAGDDEDAARLGALSRAFPDAYALERQIGRGGMARVYRAIDRKHGRPVAIKVMRSDLTSDDGAARFLDEIQLTARLSHPHILPLLDSGSVEGTPFFVMPLVDGESLRERLRRTGRLPVDEALTIASEVADALAYAHAQGVVHCDVKPDNILLSGRHAIVADFGVARAVRAGAGEEWVTGRALVVGTPAYMSPEQMLGDGSIDGRSDVYSLGVVAFELLAGRLPHEGSSVDSVIASRLSGPVPLVRAWNPDVPHVLDGILQTAMARDRDARFATAADFAEVLSAARRDPSVATFARQGVHAAPSIAVLPFRDLSPEPDDYLSEGITEEVTAALGRVPAFRVCAGSSARALAGAALEPKAIGERLGVQHLLTGSVHRSGERLRVSAELVNAADGFQLWADKYDRTFSDVMAVQDDIAEAIAVSLAARAAPVVAPAAVLSSVTTRVATPPFELAGDRRLGAAARSRDPMANELYLRGRFLWNRRTAASLVEAIRCFEASASLEPRFALAHAGVAAARAMTALYGAALPAEAMSEARHAAERALSLDAACAEARMALGLVLAGYDWKWADAERQFHAASVSSPSDATPHQWLATMCLLPTGRIDEALTEVGRALRRDPLSLTVKTTLASVLYCARRYEEAVAAARDVALLDPAFAPAHFFLGQALTLLGDHAEAVGACLRACDLASRSAESLAVLCVALSRSGDVSRARAVHDELTQRAESVYVSKGQLGLASLGAGEPDAALDRLDAAVEERATDLIWLAARPVWDPLRGHARFDRILQRIGLLERGRE